MKYLFPLILLCAACAQTDPYSKKEFDKLLESKKRAVENCQYILNKNEK